ncbi:plexin domain-containing protein 2 isoform X1 [Drosophila elegans]|uniref:plexin domain-containing protein 2 isoform X1 n=1 Tax=Drosophila elegans TaxID=30023 RepID=UPI0007E7D53A|nr:plexin domain-containing protein 2 isoform X1 [Drosophila elegans]
MAKSVGCACARIAILLALCHVAIPGISAWSNQETYDTLDTTLPFLNAQEVVRLTTDQLNRQKRAVPVDAKPDATSQYQSVVNVNGSATVGAGAAAAETTVTTVDNKAAGGSVSYNVHNVGVNGTGQRKAYSVGDGAATGAGSNFTTTINMTAKKPTQLVAQSAFPKKVAASAAVAVTSTDRPATEIDVDVAGVDVPDDEIENRVKNESLVRSEDFHDYYNSVLYVNPEEVASLWTHLRTTPENTLLSSSHRRAMTVELKFDFPFYGHFVRNITVATGGFLYTGEYVHSWLAATQYIAPLMANFDTSMSKDSFVRVQDNGTAFVAVWENVTLQDKPDFGKFTFSVTLHQSGDIVFAYLQVPTHINSIQDKEHPVKVGLSDAYIIDKHLYFARRKTIYEYHRVTFQQQEITNSTIIKLAAQPTCLGYNDCTSCINHNTTFTCLWCSALNRCSTGTDRKKHEWLQKGCETAAVRAIESCPALGEKGNNASPPKSGAANSGGALAGSTISPVTAATGSSAAVTEPTVISTRPPHATAQFKPKAGATNGGGSGSGQTDEKAGNAEFSKAGADNKSVGMAFGFMVPICLVFAVTLWLFYAYRNPHTKSGQLLIQSKHLHQFRPSQWSWRRGEARYTAATIHM